MDSKIHQHRLELHRICLFIIVCLIHSCGERHVEKNDELILSTDIADSLYVADLGTGIEIVKFSGKEKARIALRYGTIGSINVENSKFRYLTILESNAKINVKLLPDSSLTTNRVSDSLLNYLSSSTIDFINKNSESIFNTDKFDSIVLMFDKYKIKRERIIDDYADDLSTSETKLLKYYNVARLFGYLQFFGMITKNLEPSNSFFNFIEKIDEPEQTMKTLPSLYLNKYKIEYLREFGSMDSLPRFLRFIDSNVEDKDLSDFMRFSFIKELVEGSQFWGPEQELLNTMVLTKILEEEDENNYSDLIELYSKNYFHTQKGENAFNFSAENFDGPTFILDELKGKVVFIDTWATWCAPCIKERPKVLHIAKKFGDQTDFQVLMVSVDDSKERWLNYLSDKEENSVINLFIADGLSTEFGKRYNINSIPNYVLIDKQGLIVDAYIKEPSDKVVEKITKELSR